MLKCNFINNPEAQKLSLQISLTHKTHLKQQKKNLFRLNLMQFKLIILIEKVCQLYVRKRYLNYERKQLVLHNKDKSFQTTIRYV